MPVYEYHCNTCGQNFDKLFRSLSQIPAEIACPSCHSKQVRRVMSAPAVHTGGPARSEPATDVSPAANKPPVFGRKELKAALEKKAQLREQSRFGD